ncbi:phytoene/squalene synthase family protein [Salinibaculum rarum]|uniref:phytoene/squalene synthase family protein n=1 Tax=Salinibaculum rarum TaxID=3058903 RepID=UPI00265E4CB0|nr:phytoene/squalene synthase family protein [Salinibaculum sp. KK48]
MTPHSQSESNLEWCYDAVQDVSRTFAITIAELDEPMARDICVGYLVCRVADTIEDDDRIPPAEKAQLLRSYRNALDGDTDADGTAFQRSAKKWIPDDPNADWRVVENTDRVLSTFYHLDADARERIRPPVRELVDGMAMFVDRYAEEGGLRIQTIEELEEYCWYAAGTVGTLVTNLVSQDADPAVADRLDENARAFSLLLQLVNVAKDVAVDYEEENNVYLPDEWLADAGVSPEDIGTGRSVDALASVVERVTDHAAGYLDGGQAWLEAMPERRGNTLAAWAVPYLLAVGTIRELRQRPRDVFTEGGVKISREEVYAVMRQFSTGADATDVARLREQIATRPLPEW